MMEKRIYPLLLLNKIGDVHRKINLKIAGIYNIYRFVQVCMVLRK